MPYVGNPLADAYSARVKQDLTGGSGTSFTLSHAVSSPNDLSIYINHVRQEPTTAYTVNGTALTMTGSVAGTDDFYIIYDELAVQSISHPTNQALTATAGTFTSGLVGTTGTFSGALSGTTGTFSDDLTVGGTDLFIDTSAEKLGIGTATASQLHQKVNIYSSAEAGIQFMNDATGVTNSTDGCRISVYEDDIQYTNYETSGKHIFNAGSGPASRLEIESGGDVNVKTGDLIFGTAGKGICLGVTSNTDSNTLDDYEEGTWTPTIYGSSGSAGSQQINGQEGKYIKVGRLVYVTLYFYLQNGGAGSWTGTNRFGGFPFTSGTANWQAMSIGADGLNAADQTFTISGGQTYGHMVDMFTGTSYNYSSFITGYSIQVSGSYYTT